MQVPESEAMLEALLAGVTDQISHQAQKRILEFYKWVCKENELQNLTRLISGRDFFEGHVCDVLAFHSLQALQTIEFPALDLGSGVGVPGALSAIIRPEKWVLIDSEWRKADYLKRTVEAMGLNSHVQVESGRVEDYLKRKDAAEIRTVVARAVGSVEKIYAWIRKCSTWNKLVLFKGPGWNDEWKAFQAGKFNGELKLDSEKSYEVGEKSRRIVILSR